MQWSSLSTSRPAPFENLLARSRSMQLEVCLPPAAGSGPAPGCLQCSFSSLPRRSNSCLAPTRLNLSGFESAGRPETRKASCPAKRNQS